MPEDDELLAAFAEAVDATCTGLELGSGRKNKENESDQNGTSHIKEDTDE